MISRAGALRARAGATGSAAGTVRRVLDQVGGVAVVCDVGGQRVLAVPEPGFQPIPGSPIDLVVDSASLHVIDEHLNGS